MALPTLRTLPAFPEGMTPAALTATSVISPVMTLIAGWIEPIHEITVGESQVSAFGLGQDGAVRGQQDAALLSVEIYRALGWLSLFTMLGGPLGAILPVLMIRLSVRMARAMLRIVRYLRIILPR